MKHWKIQVDGRGGYLTQIEVDGQRVWNATFVGVEVDVNGRPVLTIKVRPDAVELEGDLDEQLNIVRIR